METCCISCKKNTVNENPSVTKTKQNRLMFLSNCTIYGKKKLTIILKIKNTTILIIFEMISLK